MKKALIVIDVQDDYFEDGKYPLHKPQEALHQINRLEAYFKKTQQPIIYVQHINLMKGASFFEVNTSGVKLHHDLNIGNKAIIVEKQYPNSFFKTNLLEILKNHAIEALVITGMMTHMCIDSTTRAAKEYGFNNLLIHDATATRDLVSADGKKVLATDVQTAYLCALMNFSQILSTNEFLENE